MAHLAKFGFSEMGLLPKSFKGSSLFSATDCLFNGAKRAFVGRDLDFLLS